MLPGIRILFALVVLSFAILVFGFGALALLRSAHQHMASQPAWQQDWRTPVEIANAQRDDRQSPASATQTLALLRVDPPATKPDVQPAQSQAQSALDEKPPAETGTDVGAPPSSVSSTSVANADGSDKPAAAMPSTETASPNETTADRNVTPPPVDDPVKAAVSSDPPKVADLPNPANDQAATPAAGPDVPAAPAMAGESDSPHAVAEAAPSPLKAEPTIKLAALPDTTAASNETRQQARQQSARQPDAADLRAKRRARARLRARRLAQARARAARLAQTQQATGSSYYSSNYNSNFTTTGSAAPSTTPNATPFGAPRGP